MGKIDHLSMDTVQYRPGRIDSTREYVVHSNYIVVYRVNEPRERVEILRLLSVWSQP